MLIQFERYDRGELARLVNQPGRHNRRAHTDTGLSVWTSWRTRDAYIVHHLDLIATAFDDAPFDVFAMLCPFPPPPDVTLDEREEDVLFLYDNCLTAWERRCEWWLGNTDDGFDALNKWAAARGGETVSVEVTPEDVLAEYDRRYPRR
jgi:hypothetical protein